MAGSDTLLSESVGSERIPSMSRVEIDSCAAVDEPIQVIMLLEVDRILDQKSFEVPNLMIRNVLQTH